MHYLYVHVHLFGSTNEIHVRMSRADQSKQVRSIREAGGEGTELPPIFSQKTFFLNLC